MTCEHLNCFDPRNPAHWRTLIGGALLLAAASAVALLVVDRPSHQLAWLTWALVPA